MKKFVTSALMALALLCSNGVSGQIHIDLDDGGDDSFFTDGIFKVTQNDKILSLKGKKLLKTTDILSLRVSPNTDTIKVALKPDALKKLDSTPGSYEENKSHNKKSTEKKKK